MGVPPGRAGAARGMKLAEASFLGSGAELIQGERQLPLGWRWVRSLAKDSFSAPDVMNDPFLALDVMNESFMTSPSGPVAKAGTRRTRLRRNAARERRGPSRGERGCGRCLE